MTKALFVCGKGRQRSPTAADVGAGLGAMTDYAGLSNDADERLSTEHIEWADVIFVMERRQRKRLSDQYGPMLGAKRVVCLDIPDRYRRDAPELIAILEQKLRRLL